MDKIIEIIKKYIWIIAIVGIVLVVAGIWTVITKHPVITVALVIGGSLIGLVYYLNKKK